MKKPLKIAVIVAAALILTGAILGAAVLFTARGNAIAGKGGLSMGIKIYTSVDDVDAIEIESSSGKVEVIGAQVEKPVVEYSKSQRSDYEISERSGRLVIKQSSARTEWYQWLIPSFGLSHVTVKVPLAFEGDVIIVSSSGEVQASGAVVNKLDVSATSGQIDIDGVSANSAYLSTTSGGIRVSGLSVKDGLYSVATSGSMKLDGISAGNKLSASTTSGSIRLSDIRARDIELDATSGSIRGEIYGRASDYSITSSTGSGSSNLPTGTQGEKRLSAKTSSGSIKIEFAE